MREGDTARIVGAGVSNNRQQNASSNIRGWRRCLPAGKVRCFRVKAGATMFALVRAEGHGVYANESRL